MTDDEEFAIANYPNVSATCDKVKAENARLKAALKPFAEMNERLSKSYNLGWPVKDLSDDTPWQGVNEHYITLGDLRNASRALGGGHE